MAGGKYCGSCNKPKSRCKCGRPIKITPKLVRKLKGGFLKGLSDRESCLYAGICYSTFTDYCQKNSEFSDQKESLKQNLKMRSKLNIAEAIIEKKVPSLTLSTWYLERRDQDFKPASKLEHSGKIQNGQVELTPEIQEAVRQYEEIRNKQILEESKVKYGKAR